MSLRARLVAAAAGDFERDELPFVLGRRAVNLLLDQGDDVAVVDFLLLVGQLLEFVEHGLQLLARQLIAQSLGPIGQRGPAAVLAQHQIGLRESRRPRAA